MKVYFDTSGLIKKYLSETGSDNVIKMCSSAQALYSSRISYAEMMATLERKIREAKNLEKELRVRIEEFQIHWLSINLIDVNENLKSFLDSILSKHPLKGADAIHLASALYISQKLSGDLVFASADEKLLKAASSEHLSIYAC